MGFRKNDLHSRYAALRTDAAADQPPTREWRAATRADAIRRIDLHGRHEGSPASPAILGSAESRAKRDRAGALHRRYGAGFSEGPEWRVRELESWRTLREADTGMGRNMSRLARDRASTRPASSGRAVPMTADMLAGTQSRTVQVTAAMLTGAQPSYSARTHATATRTQAPDTRTPATTTTQTPPAKAPPRPTRSDTVATLPVYSESADPAHVLERAPPAYAP